jgi:hypothetical protein
MFSKSNLSLPTGQADSTGIWRTAGKKLVTIPLLANPLTIIADSVKLKFSNLFVVLSWLIQNAVYQCRTNGTLGAYSARVLTGWIEYRPRLLFCAHADWMPVERGKKCLFL